MLFHITWEIRPEARNDAQSRFTSTGGLPPEGVIMHGRWHRAGGLKGYVIAETDDSVALGKWLQGWTDLLEFDVSPVVTDAQVAEILAAPGS